MLAIIGFAKGHEKEKWVFLASGIVAFWSTMGPTVFGLPSPSGLIHTFYAPFARRILLYKVFVQLSFAVLAGIGANYLFGIMKTKQRALILLVLIAFLLLIEYSIVPPVLSVDLNHNPEVYERIKALPDDSVIIEIPLLRMGNIHYQRYFLNII